MKSLDILVEGIYFLVVFAVEFFSSKRESMTKITCLQGEI